MAKPSGELTQELLRLGEGGVEEEGRVDGRIVATQLLLELLAVGLPLWMSKERDIPSARANSSHRCYGEVTVG